MISLMFIVATVYIVVFIIVLSGDGDLSAIIVCYCLCFVTGRYVPDSAPDVIMNSVSGNCC